MICERSRRVVGKKSIDAARLATPARPIARARVRTAALTKSGGWFGGRK